MATVDSTIEPILSDGEREELRHLDYFSARIAEFRERGLIAADLYETIAAEGRSRREAIERRGQYLAAIRQARALSSTRAEEALGWARRARALDPTGLGAWVAEIDLLWQLECDDEAVALCAEGAGRLPRLRDREAILRVQLPARAEARRQQAERVSREQRVQVRLAEARASIRENRDADAVEIARSLLAEFPGQGNALRILAHALHRLGRLEESLETYQTLARLEPRDSNWPSMIGTLRRQLGCWPRVGEPDGNATIADVGPAKAAPAPAPSNPPVPSTVPASEPPWSWSSIAAEFLEEHWQKLILCLAVLLIVVSSTVGAHVLLGPLLWLPAGTCAMALVWTIAFAALGWGLIQWGAERAGRMMLVATLMVAPIHFMLAGELKLVTVPTVSGLIAAVVDGVALVALVRAVTGMLVSRGQARFLTTTLLLMSVGSVATARGSPVPFGWQFAAFQAPAVVFLGAAWSLGRRRWGESDESDRRFTILALGLLGLAFLACTARIGAYALMVEPALYAVPVMLGAIAAVSLAQRLGPSGADGRQPAWIRFGGYVLSGLAFALAMTPPRVPSALFSADAVVTSLLGFGLYAASLRRERHPAFLYLCLGALVSARVAAQYLLADRLRLLIDHLRHLLGYSGPLPIAFLGLVGLVVNPALAVLSIWFRKGWKDERLALHCHYIGLPIAVAACLWSVQEPTAAAIVLAGYAVLFTMAVWLLAVPVLSYAAVGAIGGASYFGSTLIAGVTPADQALMAVGLAWIFLLAVQLLRRFEADERYVVPWTRATRAFTSSGFLVATAYIAVKGFHSPTAAAVFPMAGVLAFLGARERPRIPLAAMVLLCFVEFTVCGLSLLTGGLPLRPSIYGVLLAGDGLVLLGVTWLLQWAKTLGRTLGESTEIEGSTHLRLGIVFAITLPWFVIGLILIADLLAAADLGRSGLPGLVWLLGAPALLGTTRRLRRGDLVYLGIAQLVAGGLMLSDWSMGFGQDGLRAGWMAVSAGVLALGLWLAGVLARRRGVSAFYVAPCFHWCLGLTLVVLSLSIWSRYLAREAYRFGVLALTLNACATILLSVAWRRTVLTYPAVLHLVIASYLVLFSVGRNDPRTAFVLGLAGVVQAIIWWLVGFACERVAGGRARSYSPRLYHLTVALTVLGIALSDRSAAVLAMAAAAFLLTVKSLPRVEWLYPAVACAGASVYFRWLAGMVPGGQLACMMAGAFGLWAIGVLVQRNREPIVRRLGLAPLAHEFPFFHSSMAVGFLATAIRVSLSVHQGVAWNAYAWLPLALSMLVLLMARAYPWAEWLHLSLALLLYGSVSALSPPLVSLPAIGLVGISMGLGIGVVESALRVHEPAICERLGIGEARYLSVVRIWSTGLFGLSSALVCALVVWGMAATFGISGVWMAGARPLDWWMATATLGLAAVYLVLAGSNPRGWIARDPVALPSGLHVIVVLILWWLCVVHSPLRRYLPPTADYYPIATAIAALTAIHLARRFAMPEGGEESARVGERRPAVARQALATQAGLLAILAIGFTGGIASGTTVSTVFLSSMAIAMAAIMSGWAPAAGLASLTWAAAWSILGAWLARRLGLTAADQQVVLAAAGSLIAAFLLRSMGGLLRGGDWTRKSPILPEASADAELGPRFARVLEGFASAAALLASGAVLGMGLSDGVSQPWVAIAGLGVILGSAILHVAMASRWRSELPVYLAQALMVGAYLEFRLAYAMSSAVDAAVLTLLAYLDMAAAEVLDRLGRGGYYTRPTRYTALVLPILPLLPLFRAGVRDEMTLFYLAAAAAFYATSCERLRWKSLGYTAAVFANSALWLLWSLIGCRLVEYPQLYLVPVGLSAILFAEVNRELGRAAVNAIRSLGLTVIYIALAFPIWQFASFTAWLILLLASLLGVFIGIGLRLQTFLWLGLATFVLDVVYEMGRMSVDHAMAKWAIMLGLGIALVLFVALNEKKRILGQMLDFYAHARQWE